ncbi:MAG: hypothetical protein L0H96_05155 [Humibacillus sp.]|nr:hypothetical protein [Humibacillus sp.]MDN5776276.1 hypothetical protein [Humibacillus sp.]
MIARSRRVTVAPDQIDDILIQYRASVPPIHAAALGLRQHDILVDRQARTIEIIGLWNSPEAINAIASELEPARAGLWTAFGQPPLLKIFDVADELP